MFSHHLGKSELSKIFLFHALLPIFYFFGKIKCKVLRFSQKKTFVLDTNTAYKGNMDISHMFNYFLPGTVIKVQGKNYMKL